MQFIAHHSIDTIDSQAWNLHESSDTAFTCYEFHQSLEHSGCVGGDTGWTPLHFTLVNQQQPMALIPGYIKAHSWGEYVFDFAWAEAHDRYQRPYYPKLVAAVPFTPCAGPRLLLAPGTTMPQVVTALETHMPALAQQHGFHSWHWLFAQQSDWPRADASAWHRRLGCQYHWYNQGYQSFADFLATLQSRKRKNLNKERQQIKQQGIHFNWLEGVDIRPEHLREFFACYANTYYIRGRRPYLNEDFFQRLCATMPERILLMQAIKDGQAIAYAWYFKDQQTLYGRYWGCLQEVPLLHFEACYYQGIDYCIAQRIPHFDAGAQGEHKLTRGFLPQATHSYHWLQEQGFDPAIQQFCQTEAQQVTEYMQWANQQLPYKRAAD